MAGDDDLLLGVHVGDVHHVALGGVRADLLDHVQADAHDGGHGAGAHRHRRLHELAAASHDADGVAQAQRAGHHERRVLAQAVAGGERRREAALGAGGGRRHAGREDGRLGGGGQREVGLGPLEHHAREIDAEGVVGFLEHALGAG